MRKLFMLWLILTDEEVAEVCDQAISNLFDGVQNPFGFSLPSTESGPRKDHPPQS